MQALFQQLAGFFKQYLDDMKNVEQAIRKQWGPKIREKERQMAARMGQDVRIDPMSDPEFAAFYKQNVSAARAQYQAALDKAKEDLAAMLGIERSDPGRRDGLVYSAFRKSATMNSAASAFRTPCTRAAWPRVSGRAADERCAASADSPVTAR